MVEGGFAYKCLFMAQHHDAEKVFKEHLQSVKPSRILEIGTMHGGLTLMLRDILDDIDLKNTNIKTYDINDQEFLKPLVADRNVTVVTKNLFNSEYNDFDSEDCKREISDFIQQDGITIVLCDGGCKKCEFNLITPLIKSQDIIMAHDYAPNPEYFQEHIKNKTWDWHEIMDEDIIESSQKYNLQPYYQDLMLNIVWCSRIKQ